MLVDRWLLLHQQGVWIPSVSGQQLTSGVPAAATAGLPLSWARREEIADGIGLWARRSLAGEKPWHQWPRSEPFAEQIVDCLQIYRR